MITIDDTGTDPIQYLLELVNNQHLVYNKENTDEIKRLCKKIAEKYKKPLGAIIIMNGYIQVNGLPIECWLRYVVK